MSSTSTANEIAALTEAPEIPVAGAVTPQRFSNRRAYAQTFAATVAIRGLGAFSGVLAARILRPAGRGELAVIVFAPIMLLSLGEFEFSRSVIVESGKGEVDTARLTSTAFWVSIAMGCVEMVLLALALAFFLPADKMHLLGAARWFALYLPASYVAASLIGIDQGRGRFGRFSIFQVLPGLIYVALIVALLWPSHSATPNGFALAMLAGMLAAVFLRSAGDGPSIFGVRPDAALALRLFRRGLTFYIPSLAALLLLRADMFLLVRLAPAAAIGGYAVAQAIAMGQVGVINPFIQVGFAAVAQRPDERSALATLAHHFKLAQLAAFLMAAVAALLTPWAIRVFFGAEFAPAIVATYFLIAAAAFWGVGETLEQGLRAAGHPRLGMIASIFGLALLLAAAVPAYHRYGISGLAATVCFSQGLSLIGLIALCVSRLHMRIGSFWAFDADTFRRLYAAFASLFRGSGLSSSGA
jgi:enterobacterial common antigen flippase